MEQHSKKMMQNNYINFFIFVVLTNLDYNSIKIRFQRSYNKKSGRWAVHPLKEKKAFSYISSLQQKILESRVADEVGMNQPVILEVDDPRRISAHLAPIPPPSTAQLVLEQKSRFPRVENSDPDQTIN